MFSLLVYTRKWPHTFMAYFLAGMIELFVYLITASAFSSLHARSLYWVAMVRQNFGPKYGMKIYLSSLMGFKRNRTIATWCDTRDE